MAEQTEAPSVVMDESGNLWRHYADVGYIRLITESKRMRKAEPTLKALAEAVGPVREWRPVDA